MGFEALLAGLLLGLTSGVQCAVVCMPVLLTQLKAGKGAAKDGLRISFLFSVGRLLVYFTVSYLLFTSAQAIGGIFRNPFPESLSSILLGVILIYYCSTSLMRRMKPRCAAKAQASSIRLPFSRYVITMKPGRSGTSLLLGVVSSLSLCLPLVALISLSATSSLVSTFATVAAFWLGSSVYSIGLALAVAGASRVSVGAILSRRIGFIGSLSGAMLGIFMFLVGVSSLTLL
jgi:hypothetical protein